MKKLLLVLFILIPKLGISQVLVASFDIRANRLNTDGFNIANRAISAHIFNWSVQQGSLFTPCTLSFQSSPDNINWTTQSTGDCTANGSTSYLLFVTNYIRISATPFSPNVTPVFVTVNYAGYINAPTSQTVITAPPVATIPLFASSYNFGAIQPNVTLTGGIAATVTLPAVPQGVNGTDTNHYLYISGGAGTAEAVLITGGSAISGGLNQTIIFTPANNHSGAWNITSATAGIQEAHNVLPTVSGGTISIGAGTNTIYGGITISKSGVSLLGTGSGLVSWGSGVPNYLNASRLFLANGANTDYILKILDTGAFTGKDFAINGNSANQTGGLGHGLWKNQTQSGSQFQDFYQNIGIENTRGIGFNATVTNPGAGLMDHVVVRNAGSHCIQLSGVSDWDLYDINSGGCTGLDSLFINAAQRVKVFGGVFYSGGRYGISIASNSSKIMLDNVVVDNNANAGIALLGTSGGGIGNQLDHISIIGGESTNNGNTSPPAIQASGLYMTNVMSDILVSGFRAYNDPNITTQINGIGIESSVTGGPLILSNSILRKRASAGDRGNQTNEIVNNSTLPIGPDVGCASASGACGAAVSGSVTIAAAATTVVVNTTNVTANSNIVVTFDEGLGAKLSVTCNSAAASENATYFVSARSAGVSFTIKTNTAPTTNPACLNYKIIN